MNGKHYEHRILPQLYNVIEARDSMSCASFRSKEVRIRSRDNFIGFMSSKELCLTMKCILKTKT